MVLRSSFVFGDFADAMKESQAVNEIVSTHGVSAITERPSGASRAAKAAAGGGKAGTTGDNTSCHRWQRPHGGQRDVALVDGERLTAELALHAELTN